MAYYTVWMRDGRYYHAYARSSQDAMRLVRKVLGGVTRKDFQRVEYIRAVQQRPRSTHWSHRVYL